MKLSKTTNKEFFPKVALRVAEELARHKFSTAYKVAKHEMPKLQEKQSSKTS